MATIRKATEGDKLDFAFLAKKFLKESKYPFKLNLDKLLESYSQAIVHEDFVILLLEKDSEIVGMLVGGISTPLFSDQRVATELAWYVDPDHRNSKDSVKLLKEYEEWALESGCSFVSMVDIDTLNDLSDLYERKGYTLTEKTYVKEI